MQSVPDTLVAAQLRRLDDDAEDLGFQQENLEDSSSWPDIAKMSLYCENVVEYIAGFVSREVIKCTSCTECAEVLVEPKRDMKQTAAVDSLITLKDNGGLVHPSRDVVSVCKISETVFRGQMPAASKPLCDANLKALLTSKVMGRLVGVNLFESLSEHLQSCDPHCDHRSRLLKDIIHHYLLIRLHHQAKTYTRIVQGDKVRTFLNKTVTFKGQ
jgi:hypothetical protein